MMERITIENAPRAGGPPSSKKDRWNTFLLFERRLNYFSCTGVKPQALCGSKVHKRGSEGKIGRGRKREQAPVITRPTR